MACNDLLTTTDLSSAKLDVKLIDDFSESNLPTATTKSGKVIKTIQGVLDEAENRFEQAIRELGYVGIGNYGDNLTLNSVNEMVQFTDGTWWSAVDVDSTPFTIDSVTYPNPEDHIPQLQNINQVTQDFVYDKTAYPWIPTAESGQNAVPNRLYAFGEGKDRVMVYTTQSGVVMGDEPGSNFYSNENYGDGLVSCAIPLSVGVEFGSDRNCAIFNFNGKNELFLVPKGVETRTVQSISVTKTYGEIEITWTDATKTKCLTKTISYLRGKLDPLGWGAVGDGVTDDWFAINEMLTYVACKKQDNSISISDTLLSYKVLGFDPSLPSWEHRDGNYRQEVNWGSRSYYVSQTVKVLPDGLPFTSIQGVKWSGGKIVANGEFPTVDVNGALWFYLDDVFFDNLTKTGAANALKITEWYIGDCHGRFRGGRRCIEQFSANAVNYDVSCREAFIGWSYGGGGDVVANSMTNCEIEQCDIGLDFYTDASYYGNFVIYSLYTENCQIGIQTTNNQMIDVIGWYMALSSDGAVGLKMTGTNKSASVRCRDIFVSNNTIGKPETPQGSFVYILQAESGFTPIYENIRKKPDFSEKIVNISTSAPTSINGLGNRIPLIKDGDFYELDTSNLSESSIPWRKRVQQDNATKGSQPSLKGYNGFPVGVSEIQQSLYIPANTCVKIEFAARKTGETCSVRIQRPDSSAVAEYTIFDTVNAEFKKEYFNNYTDESLTLRLIGGTFSDISLTDMTN